MDYRLSAGNRLDVDFLALLAHGSICLNASRVGSIYFEATP